MLPSALEIVTLLAVLLIISLPAPELILVLTALVELFKMKSSASRASIVTLAPEF